MLHVTAHPAPIVSRVDASAVPLSRDPQIADLQRRAEGFVARGHRSDADVLAYELERFTQRTEWGYPQVPVTNRGKKVLNARGYQVDDEGYLTLG